MKTKQKQRLKTAVKIQVQVFWVVTPCSVAVGYHRFQWPSPWRWRQQCPPKRRYPAATVHGVTTQKTSTYK